MEKLPLKIGILQKGQNKTAQFEWETIVEYLDCQGVTVQIHKKNIFSRPKSTKCNICKSSGAWRILSEFQYFKYFEIIFKVLKTTKAPFFCLEKAFFEKNWFLISIVTPWHSRSIQDAYEIDFAI